MIQAARGVKLDINSKRQTYRETLLRLRARLRGDIVQMADAAAGASSTEPGNFSRDLVDRASESIEQDLVCSLLGSTESALKQIDAALDRIDAGSYGRCEDCDSQIPKARLEAIPYATTCVQCASRRERERAA